MSPPPSCTTRLVTEQKRSNLPWILAGCGAFLVFGCCLSGAAGVLYYRQSASETASIAESRANEELRRMEEERRRMGDGPVLPEVAGTPSVTVQASVTRAVGRRLTVRAGEPCVFAIEYPERSDQPGVHWCHTVVRCGGVALYGGGTGGYFPCTFSQSPPGVRGTDSDTTSGDRDGAFTIDTAARTFQVRDDASGDYGTFELDAVITRTM